MRLFIAGLDVGGGIKILQSSITDRIISKYLLGSFWYISKLNDKNLARYINYKNLTNDFILDSGAFTLLNNSKNMESFKKRLDEYIKDYIKFINKYDIKHFIELDIDSLIGYDKVLEIRKRIEKETNKKCIPVWHISRGIEDYIETCKNYDYIAIGGIVTKEIKKNMYPKLFPKLLKIAKKYKCKVHGLGFTGKEIKKYSFYSVDSTSWNSCIRFASIPKFKNGKISTSKLNKKFKLRIEKSEDILIYSFNEWIKYQNYMEKK